MERERDDVFARIDADEKQIYDAQMKDYKTELAFAKNNPEKTENVLDGIELVYLPKFDEIKRKFNEKRRLTQKIFDEKKIKVAKADALRILNVENQQNVE